MRPEFKIAFDFFKTSLVGKGFSNNIHWLFRENILVKTGTKGRYKFILNPDLNKPNEIVKTIYDKLKDENSEIFFYTFIKGEDCTYATIAGDDYDFEIDEGDLKKEEWGLKFGFSRYFDLAKDEIEFAEERWDELKRKEIKNIGPFDYFYLAEYFK